MSSVWVTRTCCLGTGASLVSLRTNSGKCKNGGPSARLPAAQQHGERHAREVPRISGSGVEFLESCAEVVQRGVIVSHRDLLQRELECWLMRVGLEMDPEAGFATRPRGRCERLGRPGLDGRCPAEPDEQVFEQRRRDHDTLAVAGKAGGEALEFSVQAAKTVAARSMVVVDSATRIPCLMELDAS